MTLAAVLGAGCGSAREPTTRLVVESWADGSPHVQREVIAGAGSELLHHGTVSVWYENGQLRSRGTWRYGKKHGAFRFWYDDGQPLKEMQYRGGRPHGTYREWDREGNLIREEVWVDGVRQ